MFNWAFCALNTADQLVRSGLICVARVRQKKLEYDDSAPRINSLPFPVLCKYVLTGGDFLTMYYSTSYVKHSACCSMSNAPPSSKGVATVKKLQRATRYAVAVDLVGFWVDEL